MANCFPFTASETKGQPLCSLTGSDANGYMCSLTANLHRTDVTCVVDFYLFCLKPCNSIHSCVSLAFFLTTRHSIDGEDKSFIWQFCIAIASKVQQMSAIITS